LRKKIRAKFVETKVFKYYIKEKSLKRNKQQKEGNGKANLK
jgi:hypothetical protein